jgi:hypothetical protein
MSAPEVWVYLDVDISRRKRFQFIHMDGHQAAVMRTFSEVLTWLEQAEIGETLAETEDGTYKLTFERVKI